MRILASGSCLTISRTASMPPMSGMTMSMVTRSGLSCRYFSTAWVPVSASPTISKPAWARMSEIIVRMKMASSQTRTVWLTHPPRKTEWGLAARRYRGPRRVDRRDVRRPAPGSDRCRAAPAGVPAPPTRGEEVHHLVHREAEDLVAAAHLEHHPGPGACIVGRLGLAQRPPSLDDRDQRPPHVDQARHHGRRPGNPRGHEPGQDLTHPLRLGRTDEGAYPKQQQSDDSGVTHPKRRSQDTARGCVEQAKSHRRPLRRAPARGRAAIRSAPPAARRSPDGPARARPRATADAARAPPGARPPDAPPP